jgi:hypothetical protein
MYPVCSLIGGYCAGRLYAFMHGTELLLLWIFNSMYFPVLIGLGMFIVDICEFIESGRTYTLTLSEGLAMTIILLMVNFPLNGLGTLLGYKREPISTPTRISRVPRDPPESLPWFLNFSLMGLISGCIPVFVIGFEIY